MRAFLAPPASEIEARSGPPPTFSVVIPSYESATVLPDAIESVLGQSAPPHELIVVDDGSTDDTRSAVARYGERIVYLRQDNRGTAAAFNAGARAATGEFVAVLDADDVYEPGRLEALGELALVRPDLDLLATDAYLEVAGKVVGTFCERTPFAVTNQSVEIFERCFVAWPAVRRSTLLSVGGLDESLRIAHDWDCWLRLLQSGCKAGLVPEPLLRYRITGQGSLTDNRVAALRDRVTMLERAERLDLSPEERRALERFLERRRRRAVLAEAEQALRDHSPDARRRNLKIALDSGMPGISRIKWLGAAIAPGAAARWLERLEEQRGSTRIRRGLPGEANGGR